MAESRAGLAWADAVRAVNTDGRPVDERVLVCFLWSKANSENMAKLAHLHAGGASREEAKLDSERLDLA